MIEFSHVSAGYGDELILRDVSFAVPKGSITTLIGPNGSGKTTLLRAAARQLHLSGGSITVAGRPIGDYGRKEFARTAAFMPQVRAVPAITVRGLVSHGRFPYLGLARTMSAADRDAVRRAMEDTGVSQWAGRDLRELSGGERQRVYVAMALAQDTDVVFLDEPATYLDLRHQFALLELIRELNARGKTIVLVLHDLAQALEYSHQVVLMQDGCLVLQGTPDEVYRSGAIEKVFGVQAHRAPEAYYFTPAP